MLERGKFGLEYDPRQREPQPSGLGWLLALVGLAALVSLTWTQVKRYRNHRDEVRAMRIDDSPPAVVEKRNIPQLRVVEESAPTPAVSGQQLSKRPQKVRNLLMRLEEAERRHDVEMAVTTIESLRSLPGSPAADLDNALARRLGTLNSRLLFQKRNPQWVKEVVVRRGENAERIAAENGSTLNSLACLNGGCVDRLAVGQKLYVMNHPRFNLVIRRRTRTADLALNGKFFRRYDLTSEVTAKDGVYEIPAGIRAFWKSLGVSFKLADRTELETLLPIGAPVLVSEM